MNRSTWPQDRGMQKVRDVLSRWQRGDLSMPEAGEFWGCRSGSSAGTRDRCEEGGPQGLVDRRLGKPSPMRVPAAERRRMLEPYRGRYRGWNVTHFHEHRVRDHGFR